MGERTRRLPPSSPHPCSRTGRDSILQVGSIISPVMRRRYPSSFSIHNDSEQLRSYLHAHRASTPQSHIIPSLSWYVRSSGEVSDITLCDVYSTQLSNVSGGVWQSD